jgi:hypothetical protein
LVFGMGTSGSPTLKAPVRHSWQARKRPVMPDRRSQTGAPDIFEDEWVGLEATNC